MKYTKHCLTAFMAIIISLMVWADSGELFTSGKLSSSLINCIVQDKYGYIWVYKKTAVIIELYHSVLELQERISKSGFEGRTLTLKVKFSDFTQITRSISQEKILKEKEEILPLAKRLLQQVDYSASRPIRLLGLSVSNATSEEAKKEDRENSSQGPEYRELELEFEDWE